MKHALGTKQNSRKWSIKTKTFLTLANANIRKFAFLSIVDYDESLKKLLKLRVPFYLLSLELLRPRLKEFQRQHDKRPLEYVVRTWNDKKNRLCSKFTYTYYNHGRLLEKLIYNNYCCHLLRLSYAVHEILDHVYSLILAVGLALIAVAILACISFLVWVIADTCFATAALFGETITKLYLSLIDN